MQSCVDELVRQSEANGFQLNESKCKELRISFSSLPSIVEPVTINDKQIEAVSSAKLLGVLVSDDLKWNVHVNYICKKTATRLYFLKQLKGQSEGYVTVLYNMYSSRRRVCVPRFS